MYRSVLLVFFAALAAPAETPGDLRALVRQALGGLERSDRKLGEYGFARAVERKEFSSKGQLQRRQTLLFLRVPQDGFMVSRLVERDGQAIPEEERRKNEEIIAARLAELKAMTADERRQQEDESRKRAAENTAWLRELPDALEFRLAGEETINGRPAWVLACEPRAGYRAKNVRARVFEKMRGRIWVDRQEAELVRADAEMFEAVSIGWGVLGRIDKGTRFFMQRVRAGADAWLPETQSLRLSARMMLFKTLNNEVTTRYSNFQHRSEMEKLPALSGRHSALE